jgi:hypothetical protein
MIGNLGKWFWFADQTESAVGTLAGKNAVNCDLVMLKAQD